MLIRFCRPILKNRRPGLRFLQHQISVQAASRECKELDIKVPWGKVAAKLWGPSNVEPIIALHGWQDNAGSFDPLAMHLPEDVALLAIDFPGHGQSSWIPNGMIYSSLLCVQTIHRVKEHFGIDKIGLIAHSMGAIMSFQYTTLFPDNVKFVVALDSYKPPTLDEEKYFKRFRKEWNDFFKFEKMMTSAPSYTEEEAARRWIKATNNSIDESTCKILMARGTVKKPDGTIFYSRDPRVKSLTIDNSYMNEHIKLLARQIHCAYMVLKAEDGDYHEPKEYYYDVMKVFEQCSKDFRFHMVPGTHHFHMRNPTVVAELMNPFITQYMN